MAGIRTICEPPDATTTSWILRACQEYENWNQEWQRHVSELTAENEKLQRAVLELEGEKKHTEDCLDMQQQMITAQGDLIHSLKTERAPEGQERPINPGTALITDAPMPLPLPESAAECFFAPPGSPSDTYSAALLLALAESPVEGDDIE